jgi:isopenicillin-N N-acyltransferase like protein
MLPLLDLRGSPKEMGRTHGEFARERIAANLDLYFRRFALEGGVERSEALRRGRLYLEVVERTAPDYAEMVRGIAEGSGRELLELAALNARYEILYSEFSRTVMELTPNGSGDAGTSNSQPATRNSDGCTAFVALPEATPDGHLRIGENWDWIPGVQGLMLRVEREDGLRILCFTEAGIAGGKIGLNSAGIGLAINGLVSNQDAWDRLKTPFHVRTWRILNSRTLSEAVDGLLAEERSCSANFLIAHLGADGSARAVDVETSPTGAARVEVKGGVLAHANHFFDPAALDVWQPIDDRSSTYLRCDRMQALLEQHHGHLSTEKLTELLQDHEGHPLSVCTHPSPMWSEDEAYNTVLGVVMDVTTGELLAAPGNPCETPFERYTLSA